MSSIRDLVTQEIEEFIRNMTTHREGKDIAAFAKSVDRKAYFILEDISNTLTNHAMDEISSDSKINEETQGFILSVIKMATANAVTLGWFLEHLCRNNIELTKSPSLKKYIQVGTDAQGKIDTLKKLVNETKNNITQKDSERLSGFDTMMEQVEQM